MPGTILVSVLEFLGLPFPSSPSTISLKVSMGKKEYQTSDKGEFSFPLTTLRETLVVVLQDAEGNEISYAGVETKSIVEKGLWDDIFPLEGGGQVHMKLQFVLNEDEKNRIRIMRESAMKKKQDGLLNCRTSSLEGAAFDASKIDSSLYHENADKKEESTSSAVPSPQTIDVHPSKVSHQESVEKVEAQSLSAGIPTKAVYSKVSSSSIRSSELGSSSKKRASVERTPSSVKKMISAFESNLSQDSRPPIKLAPEKREVTKIVQEFKDSKTESMKTTQGSGQLEELSTTKVRGKRIDISPNKLAQKELDEENDKPREDFMRKPTFGTSSNAEKRLDQHMQQNSYNVSRSKEDSGNSSVVEESKEANLSKSPQSSTTRRTSTHKLRTLDHEDMHDHIEISGAWIFPNQQRRFCITTGGKKVMHFLEGQSVKSDIRQMNMCFLIPKKNSDDGGSRSETKRSKETLRAQTSQPESEDVESSTGPLGQAMKVAIMVGFGVLVLLTRQRNSR